ncbi:MAG: N-acetyl sugar amidotransferase [Deltaproteobacteria bacterium]|nr:N-acetyl sugar amidotransferase [Deltaproteobacteria bacterium]
MLYCTRCVYPRISVNLLIDDDGVCSACRTAEEVEAISDAQWAHRRGIFVRLLEQARKGREGDYDCVIGVSGGKDSYYQVDVVKSLGFKPLLVTYHGNNYLPEGQGNLDRMRHVTGCDHVQLGPSVDTLVRLNRLAFQMMGDMNWHAHAGIMMTPMRVAMQWRIPLVVWGEIAWDISGMYSPDDYAEWSKRMTLEHAMRGFTWKDFVGKDGLTEQDLSWLKMPSDEEFARTGVRGIYVGNFFKWDPNAHTKLVIDKYGFEPAREPFERTYRRMSNLDDMHENGLHDYLKFIKFGYGRGSDHASKDIRTGYMSRDEGIEVVRRYDAVKPRRDLGRWLSYVGMTEDEFDATADSFRDKRVWARSADGSWVKDNIWDFDARRAQARP